MGGHWTNLTTWVFLRSFLMKSLRQDIRWFCSLFYPWQMKKVSMSLLMLNTLNSFWNIMEAALIGDNCTNQSLTTKDNSYFIGCASHWFNLSMKEFFSSYEDQINKINAIMTKLKQLIPAAKPRSFTHLKAKTKNATRWILTFAMINEN